MKVGRKERHSIEREKDKKEIKGKKKEKREMKNKVKR